MRGERGHAKRENGLEASFPLEFFSLTDQDVQLRLFLRNQGLKLDKCQAPLRFNPSTRKSCSGAMAHMLIRLLLIGQIPTRPNRPAEPANLDMTKGARLGAQPVCTNDCRRHIPANLRCCPLGSCF